MTKALFDAIRQIKGAPLTQADVDLVNAAIPIASSDPTDIDPALFAMMRQHLDREEGRIPHAYQDHLGYWTIGVGRLIDKRKGGVLANDEIDYLLSNDIRKRVAAISGWPAWQAVKDNPARKTALLSMAFQMGVEGLAGFKNSLALIAGGKFKEAAANMLQSKWAQQTPERAKRVTKMIETGVYQP